MFAARHGFRNPCTLRWLRMGWGNEGWSADTSYLEAVCYWASRIRGPILECGSGLTTLLLGIIAPNRATTLEHLPEWKEHVQQAAAKHSIPVNLFTAPLADYGGFHWYSLSGLLTGDFELVICDGPPSRVIGGRYGLLPVASRLLSRNAHRIRGCGIVRSGHCSHVLWLTRATATRRWLNAWPFVEIGHL